MNKIALYLGGGGARGAYQAGVLKAISLLLDTKKLPFNILSGASVGCVNAAILTERAHNFHDGVSRLLELWCSIKSADLYKTSNYALSKSFMANIHSMVAKQRLLGHLLDSSPMHAFIHKVLDFKAIEQSILSRQIETLEIITSCYESQKTISFYQHYQKEFNDWSLPLHDSQQITVQAEYFLASTSLPLFFPPQHINGFHYSDGHIGLDSPLRGAIQCEANKILVIGTRKSPSMGFPKSLSTTDIDFSRVLGGLINGLFLDNLERDIEVINNMNHMAELLLKAKESQSHWKPIKILHIQPSIEPSVIAQSQYHLMPFILRMFLNFLGAKRHTGALLSFLLFEKAFTQQLVDLGFADAMAKKEHIKAFFEH
jgi:NTE family protein